MADANAAGRGLVTLVLGGARSGKSRYAESVIEQEPGPRIYLATAEARDDEMAARIAEHRVRRDRNWQTIEAPHDLAGAMAALPPRSAVLIDCLTLWLSNRLLADGDIVREIASLERALASHDGAVAVVSNDVGSGIVPDNHLARRFRDLQGVLNQRIAAKASRVVLMVAGLPLTVKETP
ncbi:MAG TPA: bifunctional adenosylcobinamide kinase/adenosylcobinamide-phosphate guanylyltransferase [Methyloceanibacter sp.]|jgi:adenosylcobinamide kinase / adenosylcobinamide-phosphate guanylyltransferase|nr:bifunctional adenosylcobinamide kinase/adenosylcobinamide-phosphate guanylyltransferase [Methyloceanibacter sp.]